MNLVLLKILHGAESTKTNKILKWAGMTSNVAMQCAYRAVHAGGHLFFVYMLFQARFLL